MFGNDYMVKPLADPVDSPMNLVDLGSADERAGGSQWVRFADRLRQNGYPHVLIVPCAKGSTSASNWQRRGDSFDRTTLFGSAMTRMSQALELPGARLGGVIMHACGQDARSESRAKSVAEIYDDIFSDIRGTFPESFDGTLSNGKFFLVRVPNRKPEKEHYDNWGVLRASLLKVLDRRAKLGDTAIVDCHSLGPWRERAKLHVDTSKPDNDSNGHRLLGVTLADQVRESGAGLGEHWQRVAPELVHAMATATRDQVVLKYDRVLREDRVDAAAFSLHGTSASPVSAAVDAADDGSSNSWGSTVVISLDQPIAQAARVTLDYEAHATSKPIQGLNLAPCASVSGFLVASDTS
jgi:hypothetical protein